MGAGIDKILYHVHRDEVFKENFWLSEFTNVDVFEAGPTTASRQRMNDAKFQAYLQVVYIHIVAVKTSAHQDAG